MVEFWKGSCRDVMWPVGCLVLLDFIYNNLSVFVDAGFLSESLYTWKKMLNALFSWLNDSDPNGYNKHLDWNNIVGSDLDLKNLNPSIFSSNLSCMMGNNVCCTDGRFLTSFGFKIWNLDHFYMLRPKYDLDPWTFFVQAVFFNFCVSVHESAQFFAVHHAHPCLR